MTPYGYLIKNGVAEPHKDAVEIVKKVFSLYVDGLGMEDTAAECGLSYSRVRGILLNETYLGTDFYPAIIDRATFDKAQKERRLRARRSKSGQRKKRIDPLPVGTRFRISPGALAVSPMCADKATWLYSNIESGEGDQYTKLMDHNTKAAIQNLLR